MQRHSGVASTGIRILDLMKANGMKDMTSKQASRVPTNKTTIFSEDLPIAIYSPSSQLQAATVLKRDAEAEAIC